VIHLAELAVPAELLALALALRVAPEEVLDFPQSQSSYSNQPAPTFFFGAAGCSADFNWRFSSSSSA